MAPDTHSLVESNAGNPAHISYHAPALLTVNLFRRRALHHHRQFIFRIDLQVSALWMVSLGYNSLPDNRNSGLLESGLHRILPSVPNHCPYAKRFDAPGRIAGWYAHLQSSLSRSPGRLFPSHGERIRPCNRDTRRPLPLNLPHRPPLLRRLRRIAPTFLLALLLLCAPPERVVAGGPLWWTGSPDTPNRDLFVHCIPLRVLAPTCSIIAAGVARATDTGIHTISIASPCSALYPPGTPHLYVHTQQKVSRCPGLFASW